ncbi:hypothetical protein N8J30_004932 [Salmonella enterica subsp. enterica serovar Newport]|nr:hypothetical protein [Salmonella enterica subsp. enterica serovar Sandiego]EHG7079453.1 hypothetical protein [Salmonella enterica subsp. enterica serovar Sandiego]EIE3224679.1 hypothetical protein [Salmonella enterica subsp. enterica serovar Typhimurium]EJW0497776.1 hypothetical protein [Salmonella enterica subsp. enterica serovar Newport]
MKAVQSVFVPQTLWGNSSLSIGWLTIDSTPPVRSMEDNSDIGAGGDNITNINTPTFIGSLRSSRNN